MATPHHFGGSVESGKFANYGTLHSDLDRGREFDADAEILLDVPAELVDRTWPSTNETGWWRGQCLAFVGNEVISFRETEVLSADQVKLKGVIRRRFGPHFEDHVAGAEVFVMLRRAVHGHALRWITEDDAVTFKMLAGTRWGWLPASEVDGQLIKVRNLTTRPWGPANLRVNDAVVPPFTYASGGDVIIKFHGRHVSRNGLWASFDDPYKPTGLEHRVMFYNSSGSVVWFSKVRDTRRVEEEDGKFKLTVENAWLVSIFGGEPDWFSIRVYEKARGLLSVERLSARIRRTGTGYASVGTGLLAWQPSGLLRITGCTGPEPILQANFTAVAAHFGVTLPYPTVTGLHARQARARSQANFAEIASETGVAMHDVLGAGKRHADLLCDANFEALNLEW